MPPDLSALLMIVPGKAPPSEAAVRARLEPFFALVDGPEPWADRSDECDSGCGSWTQGWRSPEGDKHLIQVAPVRVGAFELVLSHLTKDEARAAREARWALACATELDPATPLESYARQLRFCTTAAPDAVAIHDGSGHRLIRAARARTVAGWATPPSVREIYDIQAVTPCGGHGGMWFHTHGLARTGIPDVEIFRVPPELADAAAEGIRFFVTAVLGSPVPASGESDDIVQGQTVHWIPALAAARALRPGEIGGDGDRGADDSHRGRRIALVAARGRGRPGAPPLEYLRRLDRGDAAVSVPRREEERASRLARERWPLFLESFAAHHGEKGWGFAVQFPVEKGAPHPGDVYWWSVEEIREGGGRLWCRIVNASGRLPGAERMVPGEFDAADIHDWVIDTPAGELHPDSQPDDPPRARSRGCRFCEVLGEPGGS